MLTIQVLRELDKLERIGVDGVCAMLGGGMKDASGAFNPGAGLDPWQIEMIRLFIETSGKASNAETLKELRNALDHINKVCNRIDLLVELESFVHKDGSTLLDRLLSMPVNADNTWSNGGRPTIGIALDDMRKTLGEKRK